MSLKNEITADVGNGIAGAEPWVPDRDEIGSKPLSSYVTLLFSVACGLAVANVYFAQPLLEGVLLESPRGDGGFGYDPLFFYPPLGQSFAELAPEEKNRVSHRAKALAQARAWLVSQS